MALMNRSDSPSSYYSAGELAQVLGVSRQAVRQRIGRVLPDDAAASYYSDGASRSLSWTL
jgi:hypothetical protein